MDGAHDACGVGDAAAGDIEGAAVSDRTEDYAGADTESGGGAAGEKLYRDVALIVIHGHEAIQIGAG